MAQEIPDNKQMSLRQVSELLTRIQTFEQQFKEAPAVSELFGYTLLEQYDACNEIVKIVDNPRGNSLVNQLVLEWLTAEEPKKAWLVDILTSYQIARERALIFSSIQRPDLGPPLELHEVADARTNMDMSRLNCRDELRLPQGVDAAALAPLKEQILKQWRERAPIQPLYALYDKHRIKQNTSLCPGSFFSPQMRVRAWTLQESARRAAGGTFLVSAQAFVVYTTIMITGDFMMNSHQSFNTVVDKTIDGWSNLLENDVLMYAGIVAGVLFSLQFLVHYHRLQPQANGNLGEPLLAEGEADEDLALQQVLDQEDAGEGLPLLAPGQAI